MIKWLDIKVWKISRLIWFIFFKICGIIVYHPWNVNSLVTRYPFVLPYSFHRNRNLIYVHIRNLNIHVWEKNENIIIDYESNKYENIKIKTFKHSEQFLYNSTTVHDNKCRKMSDDNQISYKGYKVQVFSFHLIPLGHGSNSIE